MSWFGENTGPEYPHPSWQRNYDLTLVPRLRQAWLPVLKEACPVCGHSSCCTPTVYDARVHTCKCMQTLFTLFETDNGPGAFTVKCVAMHSGMDGNRKQGQEFASVLNRKQGGTQTAHFGNTRCLSAQQLCVYQCMPSM